MPEPTEGELLHARVLQHMQRTLLANGDLQDLSAKTINTIAREAASSAKRFLENTYQQ